MQRAIGQCRPFLKVETVRFMLPDCLWKRKWNMTSCSWKAKLDTLHTKKTYLLAPFTFVCGTGGDRATSPYFASRNGSIHASKLSLEAQMECDFILLEGKVGHFAHGKKLPACNSFFCSWRRGRRGNVALFCIWKHGDWCYQLVARSARCNRANAYGMGTVALYPQQTKYLFANL